MSLVFNRNDVLFAFGVWWLLFTILVSIGSASGMVLPLYGSVSLLFAPGLLALYAWRLPGLSVWEYIVYAVGLSLLLITVVGLFYNSALPLLGIERPLDGWLFISVFSLVLVALMLFEWSRNRNTASIFSFVMFTTVREIVMLLVPVLCVLLSVIGAASLNNGGTNLYTLAMLILLAVYCAWLLCAADGLDTRIIPIALFFIALSLLLMTSLRGWYITGHDIQREFRVFELTKSLGVWSTANYRDAYNACLSITLVPTLLGNILLIPDAYVFKVLFQILFAFVPSIVFQIARRYVSSFVALLSALYYMVFPTFFTDMPFLNRQEIAFFFFAMMVLALFEERFSLFTRRVLFLLFGAGAILSHYSTTYIIIGFVLAIVILRPIVSLFASVIRRYGYLQTSGIAAFVSEKPFAGITISVAVLLVAGTVAWGSVTSALGSQGIVPVLGGVASAMARSDSSGARSSDVGYGLLSGAMDPLHVLSAYKNTFVQNAREQDPLSYFAPGTYAQYATPLAETAMLPLTHAGQGLKRFSIDPLMINTFLRQWSAKALQIFMVIGLIGILVTRRLLIREVDTEFILFAGIAIFFLLLFTILPVLSVAYGVLRLFQQSLLFLSVCIALGSMQLFGWLSMNARKGIAGSIALLIMLSTTGVIPQLLGGYDPQLHLNNGGEYYDDYYVRGSDMLALSWISRETAASGNSDLQTPRLSGIYIPDLSRASRDSNPIDDVYPGLIRLHSYVYIPPSIIRSGRAAALYQGNIVTYKYPLSFLDDHKDLVYTNGEARIYR